MIKLVFAFLATAFFSIGCTTDSQPTDSSMTSVTNLAIKGIDLTSEVKLTPDIYERIKKRQKARTDRLKTLKKLSCDFEKLGEWKDFLEFKESEAGIEIDGETDEWGIRRVSFKQLGKIKKGPCANGIIYLATYTNEQPDKTGPDPDYLLADGFLTADAPTDRADEHLYYESNAIVVKVGNHYITPKDDEPFLNFLNEFIVEANAYYDQKIEYRNLFVPKDEVIARNKKIRIHASDFYWIKDSSWLSEKGDLIYENEKFGKLYNHIKKAEAKWPDGIWTEVYIGVEARRPGYWFDDFLDDPKFENFKKAKLIAIPGESSWFELDPKNLVALKEQYESYTKRVDSLKERIEEINAANINFSLVQLTFDEYRKKQPFVFFKDSLGRTQVHRLSLHEIPILAEPLIYIYGNSGIRVNLKLCSNLVHRASWPEYGDGWEIQLLGNGLMWDLKSSKKVGSLFWEGFAGPIPPLKHGWMVTPSEVTPLLRKILPLYGLNYRESAAFIKYWSKVLTQAPFYRIEIIPSQWLEEICPLEITPKPEQLLRVYLRAYPKLEFEQITPPPLPSKPSSRPSYTVVEWGGVLE
jgi:hypothetical protein